MCRIKQKTTDGNHKSTPVLRWLSIAMLTVLIGLLGLAGSTYAATLTLNNPGSGTGTVEVDWTGDFTADYTFNLPGPGLDSIAIPDGANIILINPTPGASSVFITYGATYVPNMALPAGETIIDATFELNINITVSDDGNGSTVPAGPTAAVSNTPLVISATANAGYTFDNWTGTGSASFSDDTSENTDVTATANETVTANFLANIVDVLVTETDVTIAEDGTVDIQVVLSAQPAGAVIVSATAAGDITGDNTVTFDSVNWNVSQFITLRAAEDPDTADDILPITVASDYFNGSPDIVNVTVTDDDFDLTMAVSGVGTTAPPIGMITVDRDTLPYAITATQGAGYTFTDWTNPGGGATIAPAGNPNAQITAATLAAVTAQANFTLNTVDVLITEGNVVMDEGLTAQINVTLSAQPTGLVNLVIASDNVDVTASALSFDDTDWNTIKQITLTAAEDDADTANDAATITVAGTTGAPDTVAVTVTDDDFSLTMVSSGGGTTTPVGTNIIDRDTLPQAIVATPGAVYTFLNWTNPVGGLTITDTSAVSTFITAAPLANATVQANFIMVNIETSVANVNVDEGFTATFQARLTQAPLADVIVTVSNTAGDGDITVTAGSSLTFTPLNYNTYQTIELTAAEDAGDTTSDSATISLTSPGATDTSITAQEVDDDVTVTVTAGLNGTTVPSGATIMDTNDAMPYAITATPNAGYTFVNWTIISGTPVFGDANANVTNVTANADAEIQANFIEVQIETDVPGLDVNEGSTNTFQARLTQAPLADVIVTVSNTAGDGDITVTAGSSLTFTPLNYNTYQTIELTAAEDAGDTTSDSATISLTSPGATDTSITAQEVDDDVTVTVTAGLNGTTVPSGATIMDTNDAMPYAITATPNAGYTFVNWTIISGTPVFGDANANVTNVTANADAEIQANFIEVQIETDVPGLDVNEGSTNTFQARLTQAPLADVIVTVSNTAGDGDITVTAGSSLTFTPLNYNTYQTIELTAAEDAGDTTSDSATISLTSPGATDTSITAQEVDDDVTVTVTAGLNGTTVPSGATIMDTNDAMPYAITATPNAGYTFVNWTIISGTPVFGDANANVTNVTANADAEIQANFIEVQIETDVPGLDVNEGSTNTFQARLTQAPLADVIVTVSNTAGDGDITVTAGSSLTFTPLNYNTYQTIELTAAEDAGDTTSDSATISLTSPGATDTSITAQEVDDDVTVTVTAGLNGTTVPSGATIMDTNDAMPYAITATPNAGYTFVNWTIISGTPVFGDANANVTNVTANADAEIQANFIEVQIETDVPGLDVNEGSTNTFQARLTQAPLADVIVTVSNTAGDGDITVTAGSSLTFTPLNYNTYQTIELTAAEDAGDTTSDSATISLTSPGATDTSITAQEVDDDVTVTVTAGLNGTTVPSGATIMDTNDAMPYAITATPNAGYTFVNWTIISGTPVFGDANANVTNVTANADAEIQANFIEVQIETDVPGLDVNEGSTNTFQARLTQAPLADVIVTVSNTAGDGDITVTAGSSLTFTPLNYNTYQTIELTAAEDAGDTTSDPATISLTSAGATDTSVAANEVDDDVTVTVNSGGNGSTTPSGATIMDTNDAMPYAITATPDMGYTFVNWQIVSTSGTTTIGDVNLANTNVTSDADATIQADFIVVNIETDVANVNVDEGGSATFQARLTQRPLADVTVTVSNTAGDADITVTGGSSLTFTPANYDTYQLVTLSASEDAADTTSDSTTISLTSGGATDTIVTATEVDDDVTVTVNSGGNGTTIPSGATIMDTNDEMPYAITATPDAGYTFVNWTVESTLGATTFGDANLNVTDVTSDADATIQANFIVVDIVTSVVGVDVAEGGTATFQVHLTQAPLADVIVSVSNTAGDSDITVTAGNSLTFTPANYNVDQPVELTAAEDPTDTTSDPATISLTSAGATDTTVTANEIDDDVTVTVNSGGNGTTIPSGATIMDTNDEMPYAITATPDAGFTFVNWTVESTLGTTTFTDANLNVTDVTSDADATIQANFVIKVVDIIVSTANIAVVEGEPGLTFTVELNDEPTTAGATITVISDNADISVSPASLTFTHSAGASPWNVAQTVTVSGVEDADTDDDTATITLSGTNGAGGTVAATASDDAITITVSTGLNGSVANEGANLIDPDTGGLPFILVATPDAGHSFVNWAVVSGTPIITDDLLTNTDITDVGAPPADAEVRANFGTVDIIASTATITVIEGDPAGDTFTVVLSKEPQGDVTVTVVSDNADISVSPAALTFTDSAGATPWDTPQTVTVLGEEDADTDTDLATITLSNTTGSDDTVAATATDDAITLTIASDGNGTTTPLMGAYVIDPDTGGLPYAISATPNAGYAFLNWTVTAGTATVFNALDPNTTVELFAGIPVDSTIQANFIALFSLTVEITGTGTGSVTAGAGAPSGNPGGSSVFTATYIYQEGDVVQLDATPTDATMVFKGWTGDVVSANNPETITIDSPKTVTATFNKLWTLTVVNNGTGAGSIDASDGSLSTLPGLDDHTLTSGASVNITYEENDEITLSDPQAAVAAGSGLNLQRLCAW